MLTRQQARHSIDQNAPELVAAIEPFIDRHDERAQPFVWSKTPKTSSRMPASDQATSGALH